MEEIPSAALSNRQYGFRSGRSTVDALDSVTSAKYRRTNKGFFAIAVRLDIKNAFNSIPGTVIRSTFQRKGFPEYLCRVIDYYLHDRRVEEFPVHGGKMDLRDITREFPRAQY